MNISMISIKTIIDPQEGRLSVFEENRDAPFAIRRIYYIYQVPRGVERGGHAHKKLRQLLWCPYGSVRINLDDGTEKTSILLNDPAKGLLVEHNLWREMLWEEEHSVLCVAASEYYDESDYIRNYDQFIKYVKNGNL